jgi:phage/plasmid primase-like uncharacterized protein
MSPRRKTLIGDCPCCGYKNALSVAEIEGRKLYYCHAGCPQADLWAVMRGEQWNREPIRHVEPKPADKGLQNYVQQLWQSSLPAKGSLIEIYLNARGIFCNIPPALRFLSRHRHKPTGTYWPVMLAAATDHTGRLQAIHRTYLANDGKKAPVEPAKMTLCPVAGYAMHLGKAGEKLAVTEGIETGLSVMQATGIPTWAALCAGGIERLILPPLPLAREIVIAADHDASGVGERAAEAAATRWLAEGRRVRIAMPPQVGQDFNDILRETAA